MKRTLAFAAFLVVAGLSSIGVTADPGGNPRDHQLILRALPEHIAAVAEQHGLAVVGSTAAADGYLAVVEAPGLMTAEQIEALIEGDPRVESSDRILLAALPAMTGSMPVPAGDVAIDAVKTGGFSSPCMSLGFGNAPWSGYADQEAARLVRLHEAHLERPGCGAVTVAVIDTGVDPDHPLLAGALVPGYDFLLEQEGLPSEWDFLDQSLQPILEQSLQPILEQSLQPILEQSLQPILETTMAGEAEPLPFGVSTALLLDEASATTLAEMSLPPYFGHGTMVAGIVRLSAPGAQIMPLRTFNASGAGHLFDVVRAVYYAVDHGADVINMSFSVPESSKELKRAIQYARSRGVVCVASAGNQAEQTLVYPAGYSGTVGVAATTLDDQLSEFSNHGSALVALAAPGSGIVSTFPGGLFAAGWGTSFSAPLVSGAVALSHPLEPDGNTAAFQGLVHGLDQGSVQIQELAGAIGSGRLDVLATVQATAD
ncbi:MAG: S8 family serine peptidase [bacterium]|nr:S8 family serine peptidase [bacterium]